jgi:hypothetical protein
VIAKSRRAHEKPRDFPQKWRSRDDRQIASKGAAKGGRPRPPEPEPAPALPLTPLGTALLDALEAFMLHEVDDSEERDAVKGAIAKLRADDEALRSHGERVSDEMTTRTSDAPKPRERGGQKPRGPLRPKGDAW